MILYLFKASFFWYVQIPPKFGIPLFFIMPFDGTAIFSSFNIEAMYVVFPSQFIACGHL